MLITPRVSEKSYQLAAKNVYVFDVPTDANKATVIAEIARQYPDVKIADVRLMTLKGKPKSVNRGKRSRPGTTNRRDVKKAYVTVTEGEIKIAAFEEIANQQTAAAAEESKKDVTTSTTKQSSENITADAGAKKAGLFAKRRTGRRGDK